MSLPKFATVGVLGTATYYITLWSMVEGLAIPVLAATSLAFLLVVLQNYVLHYGWTFRSTNPHKIAFPRFLLMSIIGFWLNLGIMFVGVHRFAGNYLYIQAIAIAVVVSWNLLLSEFWIFADQRKPDL